MTGNNRTKSSLVGLTGVVKKAVGLGGWHWLVSSRDTQKISTHVVFFISSRSPADPRKSITRVQKLSNGHSCRLQRNALAVVALPTGDEIDSSEDDDDDAPPPLTSGGSSGSDQNKNTAVDRRAAGSAPRGARDRRPTRTPAHRSEADGLGFAFVTGKRSERSRAAKNTTGGPNVNFDKLERSTLEKISRSHYGDETLPEDPRKSALAEHLAAHFVKEKCPDENQVLLAFIRALAGEAPKTDADEAET